MTALSVYGFSYEKVAADRFHPGPRNFTALERLYYSDGLCGTAAGAAATGDRSSERGAAAAAEGGHRRSAAAWALLDAGLLVMAGTLDMDRRALGAAAVCKSGMGARALGAPRARVCLGAGTLEVVPAKNAK